MVAGFNHNIRYKGEIFHVQSEDSGRANPHVITLLYRGGTIIGSARTDYADIVKTDEMEQVVESIMKEQHQGMMRRLTGGEFDARLFPPTPPPPPTSPLTLSAPADAAAEQTATGTKPARADNSACAGTPAAAVDTKQQSLDEVILDYLIAGEEQ